MYRKLFLSFVFICFLSCKENRFGDTPILKGVNSGADSLKTESFIRIGNYLPLYVGPFKREIDLGFNQSFDRFLIDWREVGRQYKYPKGSDIKIILDTSQFITYKGDTIDDQNFHPSKAFPLFLMSNSNDTLRIADGLHFSPHIQAKNEKGVWCDIEINWVYMDDLGINTFMLFPKDIVILAIPIFKGNFKTKLRVVFGDYISEEYSGFINATQFSYR
jgi:hypothetical protein